MTLTEVYKNLNPNNNIIDKMILDILKEEEKKISGERIYVDMGKKEKYYTICEVIREIFYLTNDIEILRRCILIQLFAKKMSRKLNEYSKEKGKEFNFSKFFPKKTIL